MHLRPAVALLAAFAVTACGDEVNFDRGWDAEFNTVTLYTVDRPEFQGLPSAYDIRGTRTLRVEDPSATGNWDFALTGGDGGPLTLTPLGAFFGVASNAGVAPIANRTFEELASAPSDSAAYVMDGTVTLADDEVYVIRSRQSGGCMNFAKLDPIEIDQTAGTFTYVLMANPTCNDRSFVPPEDD